MRLMTIKLMITLKLMEMMSMLMNLMIMMRPLWIIMLMFMLMLSVLMMMRNHRIFVIASQGVAQVDCNVSYAHFDEDECMCSEDVPTSSVAHELCAAADAILNVGVCHEWEDELSVDGKCLRLAINTETCCNILSLENVKQSVMLDGIQNNSVRINGVHGNVTKAHGKLCLECLNEGRSSSLIFQVLTGSKNVNLLYECTM